ncbi:MAG: bacillithiol biosynthesis deacetylase BshB1 [Flammeovirgaceae bacterium]
MKLDILVLAAHPDDAELGCGGTIAKHVHLGYKVGVVDFTRGELGTRGNAQTRNEEASEAAKILGLSIRENLDLRDGFFRHSESEILKVVEAVRQYQPEVVLSNASSDRHPDHAKGADLAYEGCFLAGLSKIETTRDGKLQRAWRPKQFYHYIQSQLIMPHFVVDVSDYWEKKMDAVKAYKTQFFNPSSHEPETYISKPSFLTFLQSRAEELGHGINAKYGEGFTTRAFIGVDNLFQLK